MKISLVPGHYSIFRFDSSQAIPQEVFSSPFYSISKTTDELSIVCEESCIKKEAPAEHGWIVLKVEGPLDFGLTGILASIANPLAKAEISLFAVSTYDTDYILIKSETIEPAKEALKKAGFTI